VDDVQLTVFPATHSEEKPQNIRLFVFVQFWGLVYAHSGRRGRMQYPRGICMHPCRLEVVVGGWLFGVEVPVE
jgi:hypothetical protein